MSKALIVDIWTRWFVLCTVGACVLPFWARVHDNCLANVHANVRVNKISLCLYFVVRETHWFTFYLTLFEGDWVNILWINVNNFFTNRFGILAGTATWITLDGAILLFHLFIKFLNTSAATSVVYENAALNADFPIDVGLSRYIYFLAKHIL